MNWYSVLGVPQGAPHEVMRAAHRDLVRTLHPDSRDPSLPSTEADAALRLVNDAWAVLGDPMRRTDYDAALELGGEDVDEASWTHGRDDRPRFPWWIVVLALLLVIFVFTAYAGAPGATPTP